SRDVSPVQPSTEPVTPSPDESSPEPDSSGVPPMDCAPAAPVEEACTDNINEDEPDLTCSQWVEWGTCGESWTIERNVCDRSCGRCSDDDVVSTPAVNTCEPPDAGSSPAPAATPPPVKNEGPTLPPIEGGQAGFTTRYWDCCKPHCGWPGNAGN